MINYIITENADIVYDGCNWRISSAINSIENASQIIVDNEYILKHKLNITELSERFGDKLNIINIDIIKNIILKSDCRLNNAYQSILIDDKQFLLTSELSRGVNHYFLNIITSIILQLDMMKMDDLTPALMKGVLSMEESIVEIVDIIKKMRELKYCDLNETSFSSVNEETVDQLIVLKDYLNTHHTKLTFSGTIDEDFSGKKYMLRSCFLIMILFLFHSFHDKKNYLNVHLSNDKENLSLLYSIRNSEEKVDISKSSKVDKSKLTNPQQIVYWEILEYELKEINADYFINYTEDKMEILVLIPLRKES